MDLPSVRKKKRIEWNKMQLNQCSENQIEITFILQKKLYIKENLFSFFINNNK